MRFIKNIVFKVWKGLSPNPKTIFIMAHMRSGSSLLEHILSSNPEILGAGEQSRTYFTNLDLKKGELFIKRLNNRIFKGSKYVTDQVLHNQFTPNIDLFRSNEIKAVILIRNPEETISSIENLNGPYGISENNDFCSLEYYTQRLEYLVNLSRQIPHGNQIFITYEELVTNPENTLKKITLFLELKTVLNKEYNIKATTGKFGDTSKNIKEGTIINAKKKTIHIDTTTKTKLNDYYKKTMLFFKNNINQ